MIEAADVADGIEKGFEGSSGGFAQMGFEFGEGHLDRVQVGRVLRQEQHPCAALAYCRFGFGAFVNREIIEDDDIAGRKRWGQLRFDVGVEGLAVHCARNHPRGSQRVMAQPRNEGLGPPFAKRSIGLQTLALSGATALADHFGVDGRLVDEHQTIWLTPHAWLPVRDPDPAPLGDISACAFRRHHLFFYM